MQGSQDRPGSAFETGTRCRMPSSKLCSTHKIGSVVKKRVFISSAVIGVVLLGVVLILSRERGVVYQGKTVKQWAVQFNAPDPKARQDAALAFKHLGPKAV